MAAAGQAGSEADRSSMVDLYSQRPSASWRDRSSRPDRSRSSLSAIGGLVAAGAVAVIAWILVAPAVVGQTPAASEGASVSQASGAGAAIYLHSCASCHGPQGAGTLDGPDIRNAGAALVDFVLRTGRMPLAAPNLQMQRGTPLFSDADRAALTAFVASLGSGPAIPNVDTQGADVANGRSLYVANCAACHGPAGGGGSVGGGFVAPNLDQSDAQTVAEAVITGPGPMPRFSSSPDQLRDLSAYVIGLRTAPHPGGLTAPTVGPVTEGFIAGIALLGLLLVARFIGVRQRGARAAPREGVLDDRGGAPPHEDGTARSDRAE
jgi:ubiquinol-cytochrome c reductase cytochrome c subunit